MKIVKLIDEHVGINEVSVERYAKYNLNGNDFNLLMYDGKTGKTKVMVKEIYGTLYTIPFQGDISEAKLVEEYNVDKVPEVILPALRYDVGSKKLKSAIQRFIGTIADNKFGWFEHPEKFLMSTEEYRFPDAEKDVPEDFMEEVPTTLPTYECDRYIAFNYDKNDKSSIKTFAYMPYRPADFTTEFIGEDSHMMFDPAPSLDSILPNNLLETSIRSGVFNGYRDAITNFQITIDVKPGTTTVTPVILPDGKTMPVQTLVLPCLHKYNLYFAHDVNGLYKKAPNLGEARFTVSPLRAEGKTPYWFFKQGVAKFQNVKVGDQFIVGDDSRYCDYIEAQYEREHKNK